MLSGLKFFVLQRKKGDLKGFVLHIGELSEFLKYCAKKNELSLSQEVISIGLGFF